MAEFNPKPIPSTQVLTYAEFSGLMAESLVRLQVKLAKLDAEFDEYFPKELVIELTTIGDQLKNVVSFLVENAEVLLEDMEWKRELEDFFFMEKTKRYQYRQTVEDLEELTKFCEPENLAHVVVAQFSHLCSKAVLLISQVDDKYEKIPSTEPSKGLAEGIKKINDMVIGFQQYLAEPEIRPLHFWQLAPAFTPNCQPNQIDHLNLISFGFCVANSLAVGNSLVDIARVLNLQVGVDLKPILQCLFEAHPEMIGYFESAFFGDKRKQTNPWPFTSEVREWVNSQIGSTSVLPEDFFNNENISVHFKYLYDLDIDFDEPHIRDETGMNPFEPSYEADSDDFGNRGLEVALVSPGLVKPNAPLLRMSKVGLDQIASDRGILRTIILN